VAHRLSVLACLLTGIMNGWAHIVRGSEDDPGLVELRGSVNGRPSYEELHQAHADARTSASLTTSLGEALSRIQRLAGAGGVAALAGRVQPYRLSESTWPKRPSKLTTSMRASASRPSRVSRSTPRSYVLRAANSWR